MMKKLKQIAVVLIAAVLSMAGLTACGGNEEDDARREQARVKLTFLTPLNLINSETMQQTVYDFNEAYEGKIHVTLVDDTGKTALTQLGTQDSAPDIVNLGEKQFKTAVDSEYLAPLDEFLAGSETVSEDDLWENAVERFRYDSGSAATPGKAGGDATLYAPPAQNKPVALY